MFITNTNRNGKDGICNIRIFLHQFRVIHSIQLLRLNYKAILSDINEGKRKKTVVQVLGVGFLETSVQIQ